MNRFKYAAATLCLVTLLVWVAGGLGSRGATADDDKTIASFGFGLRIAGSYLVEFEQQPPFPRPPVPALATFSADGGMTVTDVQTMFGDGNPAIGGFRSPVHGTWRRTPGGDVIFRMIGFALDQDGNLGAPGLRGGAILRTTGTLSFADGVVVGNADVDILAEEEDPLDLQSVPILTIPIAIGARRIDV